MIKKVLPDFEPERKLPLSTFNGLNEDKINAG